MSDLKKNLTERFFRYVAVPSQSNASNALLPSSEGQRTLAELLKKELTALNLSDIHLDEYGILTAIKKGDPAATKIGFVAHLDTVDVGLSDVIHPQIMKFEGKDLCLNQTMDFWLNVTEHPEILAYLNEEIIFTDGTSVLGADNKAAISVVMELMSSLNDPTQHGDIYIAFVPDEEIGLKGSKKLDLNRFQPDYAYTIDSCALGEMVYETFNAASVSIHIQGITAHPMSAKNVLVNPIRVAYDLFSLFNPEETPEHTANKEGYFWFTDMNANASEATLHMSIRDFDRTEFEARKAYITDAVEKIRQLHPRAKISFEVTDVYSNISNEIGPDGHESLTRLHAAFAAEGVEPQIISMRGGTDGSALSARGLITPNFFTGAHNFHSPFEFLPLNAFMKSYQVARALCLDIKK